MKIIFFGSSHFGLPAFEGLLNAGHTISCVVTQPDKHSGRGLPVSHTVIKNYAVENGLKVYQPERVNAPETIKFLKALDPDLFVVIAYGQILSSQVLAIPKIFALNLHASLLPKYRGAAPINWAIINAEEFSGVTAMKMVREMDAGPLVLQKKIDISEEDNFLTLEDKLAKTGAKVLLEAVKAIEENNYKLTPQDTDKISFAPKLKKENGLIDWGKSAKDIRNLIRGCIFWPGAFTHYHGKFFKIYHARIIPLSAALSGSVPGEIVAVGRGGITVACGRDNLVIEELQIESKRRMKVLEFIAGHKIRIGEILGKL